MNRDEVISWFGPQSPLRCRLNTIARHNAIISYHSTRNDVQFGDAPSKSQSCWKSELEHKLTPKQPEESTPLSEERANIVLSRLEGSAHGPQLDRRRSKRQPTNLLAATSFSDQSLYIPPLKLRMPGNQKQ